MFYFKIAPSKNAFQNFVSKIHFKIAPLNNPSQNFCFKDTLQNCSLKKCISRFLYQKYTSKLLSQKINFKTAISEV